MSSPLYPRKSIAVEGTPLMRTNTSRLSHESRRVSLREVWKNIKEETASNALVPKILFSLDK